LVSFGEGTRFVLFPVVLFALAPSRLGQRLVALARESFQGLKGDARALEGQWVALDHCRYDEGDAHPTSGRVVDSDPDLGDLVARLRQDGGHRCVIVRCEDGYELDPSTGERRLRRVSGGLITAA
jgi:hypothetical protein